MAKTTKKKAQITFVVPADKVKDLLAAATQWCTEYGADDEVGYVKNHAEAEKEAA